MIKQIRNLLETFTQEDPESEAAEENATAASPAFVKPTMRGIGSHGHSQTLPSCNIPVDEVENEAVTIASDYLIQSGFPVSFALAAARRCIDHDLSTFVAKTASLKATSNDVSSSTGIENLNKDFRNEETEESSSLLVDAAALAKCVRNGVRAYCRNLLPDNNLNSFFEQSSFPKPPYEWAAHAVRNSRRKMEDRHAVLPNVAWQFPKVSEADQTAAFAVYDGHGGYECAEYLRSHGFYHVFNSISYPEDISQAFQDGFAVVDVRLLKYCEREGRQSGTTAVCAIIKNNVAYIAWAGDSRALIVERNAVQKLTEPLHDTKNKAEIKRVEDVGGLIFNFQGQDRVNGLLNITRSLGDLALKPSPLTAQPDVTEVELTDSHAVLVLASDGLFDGLDWEQVGELVREYLRTQSVEEYQNLAKHLADTACNKTSDNVSVIVVFLKPMERLKEIFH